MNPSAFTADTFEKFFDQFVKDKAGGCRLDEMLAGKIAANKKCADYFFEESEVIVELKTLNQDHGDRNYVLQLVRDAASRFGHSKVLADQWFGGVVSLPLDVRRAVEAKVQNSLRNSVRGANEQIKSTRSILKKRHDSILIAANLREHLFGPVELLRNLAGHALGRTALSIDAILLITPGVAYTAGTEAPQHYIHPVYADGKTHLGDFIEPLAEKWIKFEAAAFGLKPEVEKVYEIDQRSKLARPVGKA